MNGPRVAVVTGASRGIGRAIAQRLAASGFAVAAVARTRSALEELVKELRAAGAAAMAYPCDLTDGVAVEGILPAVKSELGPVSVLINNAGFGGPFERLDQVSDATYDAVFNTNVRALFQLCRGVLPGMKAQGWGRIVNIASVLGAFGASGSSTYVASKHAVLGYTRAVAAEWGGAGIRCNALSVGYVDTEMLGISRLPDENVLALLKRIPQGRVGQAPEVAAMVGFLCGPESDYINGAAISLDGGLAASLGVPGE